VQTGLHVGPAEVEPMVWAANDLTIAGTWCYPVQGWPRIAAQIASGALPVERVVTGRIGLDDVVADGFDALLDPDGDQIKILVSADASHEAAGLALAEERHA
jgi:(R,R)-butanediol dehydrogenase/meso-butanediol dehydrogenase/diacetyl reductase